ncbi:MAG: alpha/beta hydrolase [Terriglobales bacterium]
MKNLTLGMFLLLLSLPSLAQLPGASPLIADPADKRFKGVDEDWTSPLLGNSHLRPAKTMEFVAEHDKYTTELVRVQWRWGDPIDLYVIRPKGVKKYPVVLYLFGYPSETDIFKDEDFQADATKDGFAAVGFVTALTGHRYHDIPMKKWFVSELQRCLAVSAHDVQMVLDYLASRGDLDMDRVGVFSQLSGASIGILASAADPRIKVLDALDPWGDWPMWMATSPFVPKEERPDYLKPEFLSKVALLEPIDWMPKVQAKKFRLLQRSYELETPTASKEKLQKAAPPGAIVEFCKNQVEFAYVVGEDGRKGVDWIKGQLRSLPAPTAASTVVAQSN